MSYVNKHEIKQEPVRNVEGKGEDVSSSAKHSWNRITIKLSIMAHYLIMYFVCFVKILPSCLVPRKI